MVASCSHLCIHTADLALAEEVCASACERGIHSATMRLNYLHTRRRQTCHQFQLLRILQNCDFNSDNSKEKPGCSGMAHSLQDKLYLTATFTHHSQTLHSRVTLCYSVTSHKVECKVLKTEPLPLGTADI